MSDQEAITPPTHGDKFLILIIWVLIALTVFCALTLYSRHIPEEWATPVKGLSAMVASLFALFGLKGDTKMESNLASLRPSKMASIAGLSIVLSSIIAVLIFEENSKLTIQSLPGTEIYIDKNFARKVLPDGAKVLELRSETFTLKWGNHQILLKNNPLCPGQEEAFQENLHFWDALPGAKKKDQEYASQRDRNIKSRMLVSRLFTLNSEANSSSPSSQLLDVFDRFWNDATGSHLDRGTAAIFELSDDSSTSDGKSIVVSPTPKDGGKTKQTTLGTVAINSNFKSSAGTILENFQASINRHYSDDDLVRWMKRRMQTYASPHSRYEPGTEPQPSAEMVEAVEAALKRTFTPEELARSAAEAVQSISLPLAGEAFDAVEAKAVLAQLDVLKENFALPSVENITTPTNAQPPSKAYEQFGSRLNELGAVLESSSPGLDTARDKLEEVKSAVVDVKKEALALTASPNESPPVRLYLHIADETQRAAMKALSEKDQFLKITVEGEDRPLKVMGIQNVSRRGYIPDTLEVRYFMHPKSRPIAQAILDQINESGLLKGKARVSYVVPSDADRKQSVDLGSHIEIWAAKDSFAESK